MGWVDSIHWCEWDTSVLLIVLAEYLLNWLLVVHRRNVAIVLPGPTIAIGKVSLWMLDRLVDFYTAAPGLSKLERSDGCEIFHGYSSYISA